MKKLIVCEADRQCIKIFIDDDTDSFVMPRNCEAELDNHSKRLIEFGERNGICVPELIVMLKNFIVLANSESN